MQFDLTCPLPSSFDAPPAAAAQDAGWTAPNGIDRAILALLMRTSRERTVQMHATMIGLDIAKSVFQVHGEDADRKLVLQKRMGRAQMIKFALIGLQGDHRL